jgi:hypothetical protein
VERPGRANVDVAAVTDAEDEKIGTEIADDEDVFREGVTFADDREIGAVETLVARLEGSVLVGMVPEDESLPPIAGEPRTTARSAAMKIIFTPKNYTK